MEALLKMAEVQRVVNSLDFERLTSSMGDAALQSFKNGVSVIDSINGIKVASLFSNNESVLDRAELQGGLNSTDYGALNRDDKAAIPVRGINLDDTLQSVGIPSPKMITRIEFDAMTDIQQQDAVQSKNIVDKLPTPDLTRNELHSISLRIAQQTKQVSDGGTIWINEDAKED